MRPPLCQAQIAAVAQVVGHALRKRTVAGSIPTGGRRAWGVVMVRMGMVVVRQADHRVGLPRTVLGLAPQTGAGCSGTNKAQQLPAEAVQLVSTFRMLMESTRPNSCGVRTHALTDWRLKPAP